MFPLLPVMGADMGVQAVPSLEVLLTKGTGIARGFDVGFNMFLHILLGVVAVPTDMTNKRSLRKPPYQRLDFLIDFSVVGAPRCKTFNIKTKVHDYQQ